MSIALTIAAATFLSLRDAGSLKLHLQDVTSKEPDWLPPGRFRTHTTLTVTEDGEHFWLLLAGWLHYLAFDLLIGRWEVRDAQQRGIPHLLVIPCLALTFLFGPAGWLLYRVVQKTAARQTTGGSL